MRQPYELFTGLRYTRAKRRNHFISFISIASMAGITVGVMALIVVLSVMNGFEVKLRQSILGMAADATISAVSPQGMTDWQSVRQTAMKDPEVTGAAPYVSGQGMLRAGSALTGVELRGIDPQLAPTVSKIAHYMKAGSLADLKPGGYGILLGQELAQALGVEVGSYVDLMIPMAAVTPAGILPRFRRFTVVGIFKVDNYQYDRGMALTDMRDLATLYRMGDAVTGVRLKVRDVERAPQVSRAVARTLPGIYYVTDWTRTNATFFQAVGTEKTVMFIILSFIVLVAVFNIVSTLVMVVQDKQSDIAILRTLGATPRSIISIFMVQGSIIGFVGTAIGVILGVTLALNVQTLVPILEALTHHQFLNPQIYYISQLPSKLEISDVVRVTVLALVLGFFSTLYPAWRASKVQPAEALRYE
ncbi:MAG TPA: lipoprotein-releasing ABC transporter permease subunit [Nevskiaceae bacterium]|nr:lipoprotein-releasing ABC transporter permease subunit [Nevskiaceae bacterium]